MPNLENYSKPFKDSSELLLLLKERGLNIEDKARVISYLEHINYYRFSAYIRFFEEPNNTTRTHKLKENIIINLKIITNF